MRSWLFELDRGHDAKKIYNMSKLYDDGPGFVLNVEDKILYSFEIVYFMYWHDRSWMVEQLRK